MPKCYIIAAGDMGEPHFFMDVLKNKGRDDLIICADGGFDNAKLMGVIPDIVLGDMDSVRDKNFGDIAVIVFPKDKNKTDTHLAVDYALDERMDNIILLAATGGRASHFLANVYLLKYIADRGAEG